MPVLLPEPFDFSASPAIRKESLNSVYYATGISAPERNHDSGSSGSPAVQSPKDYGRHFDSASLTPFVDPLPIPAAGPTGMNIGEARIDSRPGPLLSRYAMRQIRARYTAI